MSDSSTAQRRGTTLSPQELFVLDQWGRQLREAFGQTPYLVGSVERGENWRDVDVRMILPWPVETMSGVAVYTLNIAVATWGKHVTGLPIDFQFQAEEAFHSYDGQTRNPLGGRSPKTWAQIADLALGIPRQEKIKQHTCTPGLIGSAYGCPACGIGPASILGSAEKVMGPNER